MPRRQNLHDRHEEGRPEVSGLGGSVNGVGAAAALGRHKVNGGVRGTKAGAGVGDRPWERGAAWRSGGSSRRCIKTEAGRLPGLEPNFPLGLRTP